MEKIVKSTFRVKIKPTEYIPAIIGALILIFETSVLITGFLIIFFSFCILVNRINLSSRFVSILFIAFALRVIFILLDETFHVYPYSPDSAHYNQIAIQLLRNYNQELPIYYNILESPAVKHYGLVIAFFYNLLEQNQIIMKILNAFIAIISAVKVHSICRKIYANKNIAFRAGILTAFYPSLILFSCLNLRDSIILYLSYEMIFQFILTIQKRYNFHHFIKLILIYLVIGFLRPQNFFLFSVIFVLYFLIASIKGNYNRRLKIFYLFSLVTVVFIFVFLQTELVLDFLTYPIHYQPKRTTGGSAYLVGFSYNNFWDLILYSPLRFLYFTFGPFIWDVQNSFMLIAFFESLIIMALFYFSIKYFITHKNALVQNTQIFLLLFGLLGLLANSLVDSNYGTAIRHRMIYIIPFIIFASAYLENVRWFLFKRP